MEGKVCLITGGADGIGKASAREFLKNGAKVAICDIDERMGHETIKELKNVFGNKVEFYVCDISNDQQFEECFQKTVKQFGALDVVFNNAGLCDEARNSWEQLINVNLRGTIKGTKLGMKYMSKKEGGRGGVVINTGSICVLQPYPFFAVYSASKAAINQFSRSIGSEVIFNESGVKVIAINPGKTLTKMLDASINTLPPDVLEMVEKLPSQSPEFVAKCVTELIHKAPNGSLWTIEAGQQPFLTILT